jgi:predicted nucleic acid-binding Zn ribbon protein
MDSPFIPKVPRASNRKNESHTLKEAIESLLKIYQLQNKFDETYVEANWEQIMGKPIAARTISVNVKNQKLYLKLDSAPLKKELLMAKNKMIELINKSAQNEIVKEIIFL